MKILIVCPLLPYPPIDGGKIAVYYPIRYLSERGHSIHLACLSEFSDPAAEEEMKRYCTLDVVRNSKTPTMKGALMSLFSTTPYDLSRFHNKKLLARIRALLVKERFDIFQLEGIHSAFYGLAVKDAYDIPLVMRVSNVHSVNIERLAGQFRNPFINAFLSFEAGKVQRYEAKESPKFDDNLMVSEQDAGLLKALNPSVKCTVIPIGVEIEEYSEMATGQDPESVLWMGSLQWIPNQDSAWWFIKEIAPKIAAQVPSVSIRIVGSNPPRRILDVRHPNIQVVGFVDDIRASIQRAQVCVVPLRVGSGIRVKLLEMFSLQKAVVSTSVGCEGLNVKHEEHLLIADDVDSFAKAVVRLLSDPPLREHLGRNAMRHAKENFSWDLIAAQYEATYQALIREHGDREPKIFTS